MSSLPIVELAVTMISEENAIVDVDPVGKALVEALNEQIGHFAGTPEHDGPSRIKLKILAIEKWQNSHFDEMNTATGESRICTIKQRYYGPFSGDSILFMTAKNANELIAVLIDGADHNTALCDTSEDAMREIGNILMNTVLIAIARLLKAQFSNTIPQYAIVDSKEPAVSNDFEPNGQSGFLLRLEFTVLGETFQAFNHLSMSSMMLKSFETQIENALVL